jgi:hypothetical protein
MKHFFCVATAFLLLPTLQLAAVDITVSGQRSSFIIDKDGDLTPNKARYGLAFALSDQIREGLEGKIAFDSDAVNGNTLSARAAFKTSYFEISGGPSFGVLNPSDDTDAVSNLFQPGLGVGFSITAPGIVVAKADTDFALPSPSGSSGQVYLQRSELSAGFYLPRILCKLGIIQKTNIQSGLCIRSMTDYGLYTESYAKGSPFRVSVDFVYRILDYYVSSGSDLNKRIGNLILGGGLTWAPKTDFNVFVKGNGAIYSFSLGDSIDGLDKFMFDISLGVSMKTAGFPTAKALAESTAPQAPQ